MAFQGLKQKGHTDYYEASSPRFHDSTRKITAGSRTLQAGFRRRGGLFTFPWRGWCSRVNKTHGAQQERLSLSCLSVVGAALA